MEISLLLQKEERNLGKREGKEREELKDQQVKRGKEKEKLENGTRLKVRILRDKKISLCF